MHPLPLRRGSFPRLLTAVAALSIATPAFAQTGPFAPSQPYFTSPFGSAGVEFQSGQIWVDVNGSGLNDAGDTFHPIPNGVSAAGWDLRLTPSRRVLVAFTSSGLNCPGTTTAIRLYQVPAANGASFTPLGSEETLTGCIQQVGFNDVPTNPARTAFFRGPADGSGGARILWWDLATGVAAFSPAPYQQGFGFVDFAPTGTMAWVQHDIDAGFGTAAYSIVELCPTTLGQASQPGLTNQPDVLRAHVEDSGGTPAVVARTTGGTLVASFAFEDCALPPPVTGACCLPGGGCLGGTTQAECETTLGGTWQGPATACAPSPCPPPPAPQLAIEKDGPVEAERGTVVLHTLIVENTGTGAATSVVVVDSLPALVNFVFALNGGTFDPGTRRVTWNLGTLNPGGWHALMLAVRAPCSGASLVNDNYRVTATGVGSVTGAPVTTTLLAPNTTPLTVAITSTAQATPPLVTGDRVRHSVQLTNTLDIVREGVRVNFTRGEASDVVALVDSAGGTFRPVGAQYQWEGSLEALGSKTIVWETAVRECRPVAAAIERINGTGFVLAQNRCGQSLGFGSTATSYAVAGSPFTIRLDTTNPAPASQSGTTWIAVARPGGPLDFSVRFIHASADPAPMCSLAVQIPFEMTPAGNPPFVGSPPAGTSWDPLLQIIRWSGTPPAGDSVVIAFRANAPEGGCQVSLLATGWRGSCPGDLFQTLGVIGIPEPPAGAHLVGLDPSGGVYTHVPGQSVWNPLVCGTFASSQGLGLGPDGSLWVVGSPTYRVNAATLDFEILPSSFNTALGIDFPFDCATDPTDSTLVFAGYRVGFGLRVRRWDPAAQSASVILDDPSPNQFGPGNSVVVEANGFIGIQTGNAILRVNPAGPTFVARTASDAGASGFGGLGLDVDGTYLVAENGPSPRRLFDFDFPGGAFPALADLDGLFQPGPGLSGGVARRTDQLIYVGSAAGEVMQVHRTGGTAVTLPALAGLTDLLYVDGPLVDVPAPPSAAPVALAIAAAPNPVRHLATLRFALPRAGRVALEVFDLGGRRVRRLAAGWREAGEHAATWDGRGESGARLGAGLYFARITLGGEARAIRVVLSP